MSVAGKLLGVFVLAQEGAAPAQEPASADRTAEMLDAASRLLAAYGLRVAGALVFLITAWIVSAYIVRAMVRGLTKAKVEITLAKFLSNVARWLMLVLVVIACLGIFGVPATSFVTVLGTAGLAIGLAVQGSLSHLAAGIMLMIFRPFRVGDVVVVNNQRGIVESVELFSTSLDTPDNRRIIIPNGQVFNAIIENITFHPERRVEIPVGVSYSADIDETRRVLLAAIQGIPGASETRNPDVILNQFGPSSVDYNVFVWAKASEFGKVRQETIRRVKNALDAAQLEIPFPQMVIHAPSMARKPELAAN
jgi:small conductance mechanosensitive channel